MLDSLQQTCIIDDWVCLCIREGFISGSSCRNIERKVEIQEPLVLNSQLLKKGRRFNVLSPSFVSHRFYLPYFFFLFFLWPSFIGTIRQHVKYLLYKEKYLELLEGGHIRDALVCLRQEIAPRSHDAGLLHMLGEALILPDQAKVRALLKWPGTGPNRAALVHSLEKGPCSRWLLPHHRLDDLLRQALQAQRTACLYHNTRLSDMSLLYDHHCDENGRRVSISRDIFVSFGNVDEHLYSHLVNTQIT